MKPDAKHLLAAALLVGCVVGGALPGPRHCGATVKEGRSATLAGRGAVGLPPGKAPVHAPAGSLESGNRPGNPPAPPKLATVAGDWRTFAPEMFTVQLAPDRILPFRVTEVRRAPGRTVLTARLAQSGSADSGLAGAFLVSTASSAERWEAVVVLPGEEYRVHADQGRVWTDEVHGDGWRCGSDAPGVRGLQTPLPNQEAGALPGAAAAGGVATDTVDVLFTYNPDALAAKEGDALAIDADCSNFIAASNAILENSRITSFRWNYLGAIAAPAYATTNTLQDDLDQMTTGSIAAFTAQEQAACGADQVVMLVGGWRNDAAGVAWIGGNPNLVTVVYPCLTIDRTTASTATSVIVVCHEMGHTFGCRHDRATEGARDGDGRYCYGFRFADNSGAYPVPDEGTVMSYAGSRIPYFSNPTIVYHGYALGRPAGDPQAAFNAAVMAGNSGRLAAANAAEPAPAITGQPQSAALTAGQRLVLSVTATGSGLTYQWFKDGTALGGATGPTFTIASSEVSDTGSYTVTAANRHGTATSQPAGVTVTAAASGVGGAASPAAAAGGASSGSGAFDAGSALALALLLAIRTRSARA